MLAIKLKQWLHNGTYAEGVALFGQVSNNAFLLQMFQAGENYYTSLRLRQELEQLSELLPEPKQGADADFFEMPVDVQAEITKAKKYFKQMMLLRDKLFSDEKEVRRIAALEILNLSKLNKESWAKVEYWRKYKALPAQVQTDGLNLLSVEDLIRLRDLDRNYVWKHQKKADKLPACERKAALLIKIQARRVRLAGVELKLSQLNNERPEGN